ncbi:MAG: FAD-binding oxidoreductase [Actinobacteria bacterium]|nr:FAD-binding oxidoreductase [Actinomycetota bacterium]
MGSDLRDTEAGYSAVVDELRASLDGEVIAPGDAEYAEAAKVWNGMFDERRPLAVMRPTSDEDVRRAVVALADVDAPLAIRGGGHHIAGFGGCDGGFVIDMSRLRGSSVDPAERRIRVGGGALLHDLDTAGAEHGLSVPVGVISATGVAGLVLTGGVGWQTRRYGYGCDKLSRARVVTAAGEIVEASESENADLLWGLRGGGGNFGVVTEFEFEAHEQDEVLVSSAYYVVEDAEESAALVRAYRDWSLEAGRDETAWVYLGTGSTFFSELEPRLVGARYVGFTTVSLDVSDAARTRLEQFVRFRDDALLAQTREMRIVELQHFGDSADSALEGYPRYMRGEMMRELTDSMIDGIATRAAEMPTVRTIFEMGMQGGAMADTGEMAMAVGMRDAEHLGGWSVMGDNPGEDIADAIQWARESWQVLAPGSCGGTYLNFDGEADEGRVLGSLSADRGDEKRARLAQIKKTWDPGNRFHVNHNIKPA